MSSWSSWRTVARFLTFEEADERLRAGWHVDFELCDHASGQRKRYLEQRTSALHHLVAAPVKLEAVAEDSLSDNRLSQLDRLRQSSSYLTSLTE